MRYTSFFIAIIVIVKLHNCTFFTLISFDQLQRDADEALFQKVLHVIRCMLCSSRCICQLVNALLTYLLTYLRTIRYFAFLHVYVVMSVCAQYATLSRVSECVKTRNTRNKSITSKAMQYRQDAGSLYQEGR